MGKGKTLAIMAIPLTQGLFALVDGINYERLICYKWYALKSKNTYYAVRHSKNHVIYMHREILQTSSNKQSDHRNHCGLDNRLDNLRICSCGENRLYIKFQRGSLGKTKTKMESANMPQLQALLFRIFL